MTTRPPDGTHAPDHEFFADWDAAFVLGALTPADRRRYETHLSDCARCQAGVGELSGLPGLLGGVTPADVEALDHPPAAGTASPAFTTATGVTPLPPLPADLLPRLALAAAHDRRARRRRTAVTGVLLAAAAVVLAVLVWPAGTPTPVPGASSAGTGVTAAGEQTLALQRVDADTPLAIDVTFVPQPWGTRLDLRCRFTGPPPAAGTAYAYTLFATNRAGTTSQVVSWSYGPDTTAEPVGTSGWPEGQIAALEVRDGDGTVLLRATR